MEFIKKLVRPYRIGRIERKNKQRFERLLKNSDDFKIVVGSSGKFEDGWIPSEAYFLNLLNENDWHKYFKENSVDKILAEHVWEHLTLQEGKRAIEVCYKFLKKSGRLRIAVPDGFHPSKDYIDYVKIGGVGRGSHDHKVLYEYKVLGKLLQEAGFSVELVEYFDESGKFQSNDWDFADGFVARSVKNNHVNRDGLENYTSLIIDGVKN